MPQIVYFTVSTTSSSSLESEAATNAAPFVEGQVMFLSVCSVWEITNCELETICIYAVPQCDYLRTYKYRKL